MSKIETKININLKKYGLAFADRLAQLAAAEAKNKAQEIVAKESTALVSSIKIIREHAAGYMVYSETEYAAAQEWGLPDVPNYTFTPYMRPAASWAEQPAQMQKYITRAEEAALRIAKATK